MERIRKEYRTALAKARTSIRPPLWDGHTAERCLQAIMNASEKIVDQSVHTHLSPTTTKLQLKDKI